MSLSTTADFFVPELFVEAIQGAFIGVKALYGTRAVIMSGTMPPDPEAGSGRHVRKIVNIPYFNSLGDFQIVPTDGDALDIRKISHSKEQANVEHAGVSFSMTDWARMAAGGGDPYVEGARQMAEGFTRAVDQCLITAALESSQKIDVYSATAPRKLDLQLMNQGLSQFADEQQDELVLMVVHSVVLEELRNLVDSTGRPLLMNMVDGSLPRFMGVPVAASNRITPAADAAIGKYTTAIFKPGSVVCWYDGVPVVETDRDITVPTQIAAVHTWFAAHAYKRLPGRAKGGVVLLVHN